MHNQTPDDEMVLPLAEEEIFVSKREVVKDRARVRILTEETQSLVRAELASEDVEIRHVAMDRMLEEGAARPEPRVENGVTIIPVFEEVAVAVTRIRLKEEIHIIRHPTRRVEEFPVTLRSQRAVVERLSAGGEEQPGLTHKLPIGGLTMTQRTLTAFFTDRSEATSAVERLAEEGIPRSQIRILPETDSTSSYTPGSSYDTQRDEKGFWESLGDLFFPTEDRYSYAEAMNRGDIMVTATVSEELAERAEDILDDHGTVNIDERESAWRSEGWAGWQGEDKASTSAGSVFGSTASASGTTDLASRSTDTVARMSAPDRMSGVSAEDDGVISLAEEELRVGKRDVSRGHVKVRSYVIETPVEESVSLREERVNVERRPVDRVLGEGESDELFRERSLDVEERGEEAVIEKRARVREEVAIGKTSEDRTETIHDSVRRSEVEVDDGRESGDGSKTRRRKA